MFFVRWLFLNISILALAFFSSGCGRIWGGIAWDGSTLLPVCDTSSTGLVQTWAIGNGGVGPITDTYSGAQTAGDLNLVTINFSNNTTTVTSVTDSAGNTYNLAMGPDTSAATTQYVYYAKNINAAAAGTNTVTITLSAAANFNVTYSEYKNLDTANPFEGVAQTSGNAASLSTGNLTTNQACTLLLGFGAYAGANLVSIDPNFTGLPSSGTFSGNDFIFAGSRVVTSLGSYGMSTTLTGAGNYSTGLVAFKKNQTLPSTTFNLVQESVSYGAGAAGVVTMGSAQNLGDTNIVIVSWPAVAANVTGISDTSGNTYNLAVGPTVGNGFTQYIYYAANIHAFAGGNQITVNLSAGENLGVQVYEYSGLSTINPFDIGTGTTNPGSVNMNSGSVSTSYSNELIIGSYYASCTAGQVYTAGAGFLTIGKPFLPCNGTEAQIVNSAGNYSATMTYNLGDNWLMQVATFH